MSADDKNIESPISNAFKMNPVLRDLLNNNPQKPVFVSPTKQHMELMEQIQQSKIRKEAEAKALEERRHQETLEAIRSSKSDVKIENKFENTRFENFQQMVNSDNSVQNLTSQQDIDYPRLIFTLKGLFEFLSDEEKEEAQETLDELTESVETNQKPSKTVLRYLKKLANGAMEKALAAMIGTQILDGGKWAIETIDALIKAHS